MSKEEKVMLSSEKEDQSKKKEIKLVGLLRCKILALRTYAGMNTAEEISAINEFEFTLNGYDLVEFEYWTNTERTQGYQKFDIKDLRLTIENILR